MTGADYRRNWALSVVSLCYALGYTIHLPLLAFLAKERLDATRQSSASPSSSSWSLYDGLLYGLVLGGYSFSKIVSAPVLGYISDRRGRQGVLLFSLLGTAVSLAMTGLGSSIWHLIICRVVTGMFAANGAMLTAAVFDMYPHDRETRVAVLSSIEMWWKVSYVLSPIVLRLCTLYGLDAGPFSLWAASGLFCLAGLMTPVWFAAHASGGAVRQLGAFKEDRSGDEPRPVDSSGGWTDMAQSVLAAVRHPLILSMMVVGTLAPTKDLSPLMASRFRSDAAAVSFATNIKHILGGLIMASPVIPWFSRRFGDKAVAVWGLVLQTIPFALLPFCWTLESFYVLLVINAIVTAVSEPVEIAFTSSLGGDASLGTFVGVSHSVKGITRFCSTLLGSLAIGLSMESPFLIGSFGLLAKAALLHHFGRR